jgi:hypothetical protein
MARSGAASLDLIERRIFFGKPYCSLGQFPKQVADFKQLPGTQQRKLEQAARFVITSLLTPAHTGGIVVAVGLRGHCYEESDKKGLERAQEHQTLSEARARSVADAFLEALELVARKLSASKAQPREHFDPVISGVGAKAPLNDTPANDYERALNRRVEVFFFKDFEVLGENAATHFSLSYEGRKV